MNRKGFAISGLVYGILIIFLLLVFSALSILVGRSSTLSKIRTDALNTVMGKSSVNSINGLPNLVVDWTTMYVNNEISTLSFDYLTLGASSPSGLDITASTSFALNHVGTEYDITFNAVNANNVTIESKTKKITEKNDIIKNFDFTGEQQEILVGPGIYKLEVWGAESGTDSSSNKGGYSVGSLRVTKPTKLYIFVGGKGTDKLASTTARTPGGFNGADDCYNGSSGGGATDIRINNTNTNSIIIVSNGGDGTCSTGGKLNSFTPGFVWNTSSSAAVTDWNLDETYYLKNENTYGKTNTFLSPSGTNETGHTGNGYARITYIVSFE